MSDRERAAGHARDSATRSMSDRDAATRSMIDSRE